MGTVRDLVTSSIIDSALPYLRRGLEDVVYEVLDKREVPSRTDFLEQQQAHKRLKAELGRVRKRVLALEKQLAAMQADD